MSPPPPPAAGLTSKNAINEDIEALQDEIEALKAEKNAHIELLAFVSHEIQAPIGAIKAMAELLHESQLSDHQTHYVNTLCFALSNITQATNDMLELAKVKKDHFSFHPSATDVPALLSSLALPIAKQARSKGLHFTAEMAKDMPKSLLIDPNRFAQVVNNLASNALKYTHQGSISLSAAAKAFGGDEYEITLTVKDTGKGIAAEEQEKIFAPFMQAQSVSESPPSSRGGGFGLGLWISKEIAAGMNGDLTCQSQEHEGSTFAFRFKASHGSSLVTKPDEGAQTKTAPGTAIGHPNQERPKEQHSECNRAPEDQPEQTPEPKTEQAILTAQAAEQEEAASHAQQAVVDDFEAKDAPAPDTSALKGPPLKGHVLIVEDNQLNQMLIKLYLDKFGITYEGANNGREALGKLEIKQFDLILMDILMPEIDGLTAAKTLHEQWQDKQHTPIIALSASANAINLKEYQIAGIEDYVVKPICGEEFYKVLAKHLKPSTQEGPQSKQGKPENNTHQSSDDDLKNTSEILSA